MKVSKKLKTWISLLLAVAMIITMLPNGQVIKAADTGMDINIHFYDTKQAYAGKVFMQYWKEETATVSTKGEKFEWGTSTITRYPLVAETETEGDDWYGLNIKGTVEGFQFLNEDASESTAGKGYLPGMKNFTGDLYYMDGTWYMENPVKNPDAKEADLNVEPEQVYYLVGSIADAKWESTDKTYPLKKNADGTFSITLENIPAGKYEFKVLQDPDNFAWDKSWGGTGAGGNYELTVKKLSNVIISLDPSTESYKVKVDVEEINSGVSEDLRSPQYNADGTVTFYCVAPATAPAIGVKGNLKTTAKKSVLKATKEAELPKGNSLYVATSAAIKDPGVYKYNIYEMTEDEELGKKLGDPLSTTMYGDDGAFVRNPVVNSQGLVTVYYPYDGKGVEVLYRSTAATEKALKLGDKVDANTAEAQGYTAVEMSLDKEFTGEGMYAAKFFDKDGSYEYVCVKNGVVIDDPFNYTTQTFTEKNVDIAALSVKSPVVNEDGSVTFMYYDAEKAAKKVQVAGGFTSWQSGAKDMKETENGNGIWSITVPGFTTGIYRYKFIINGGTWIADPLGKIALDSDGNSAVVIPGILPEKPIEVELGNTIELPKTAALYSANSSAVTTPEVTYTLKDKDVEGVSLDGNKLTVAETYTGEAVDVIITDGKTESVYSINIVKQMYTYTFHYYSSAIESDAKLYDDRDMWIWETAGKGYNTGYPFTSSSTDKIGRKWADATYSFPSNDIKLKVRSKGRWGEYEEDEKQVKLPDGATSGEFWMLDESSIVFTEYQDEFETGNKRWVIVQYERDNKDYQDWNLYTWSSTAKYKETSLPFVEVDGVQQTMFTIDKDRDSVGCILRRSTAEDQWAEKDGGDHYISTPLDQNIIIVKFKEGSANPEYIPFNKGYDLDAQNHKMNFYYRDDNMLVDGTLGSLKKVEVEINNKRCDMKYNAGNKRYEYTLEKPANGDYEYCYYVTPATGEAINAPILDAFNPRKNKTETRSLVTYKELETTPVIVCTNSAIDYNESATIEVQIPNKEIEVTDAWIDLTPVGGKAKTTIDTELMKLTFGVTDTTRLGAKTLKVTVVDQYGKQYSATTRLEVTKREVESASDFDWDESVIYFMVTDRFNDGNKDNNGGAEYDKNNENAYHGGDFAGVTEKLDYLKDLGINTIWITPVVDNIAEAVTTSEGTPAYGYHGYWATDFTKLDEHLGTEAEFKKLIEQAHNRGIRIMVDVVLNHSGYETKKNENFAGMYRDQDVSGNDILGEQNGLPDFATERLEVREKLVDWQTSWIKKYDIDYFRVDTVKHVESTTWDALKSSLTEIDPQFKMIGEYYGASYTDDADHLNSGNMDSLLDFAFKEYATNFVTGNLEGAERELEARNKVLTNVGTYGNFLSSHDESGFKYQLQDKKSYSEKDADSLAKIAASLSITAKGQPVIYYGEEIGLSGADNYPHSTNRYDMQFDDLDASQQKMLSHYKKLLSVRKLYSKVFAKGTRKMIGGSNAEKYLAFERSYKGQNVVVALNVDKKPVNVTLNMKDFAGQNVVDLYSGAKYEVSMDGKLAVQLPSNVDGGTMLLVSETEAAKATVTASELAAAKTAGKSVIANVKDADGFENIATWKFAASDLKRANKTSIKDVKLGVTVQDVSADKTMESVLADNNTSKGAVVTFAHESTLPVNASVRVYLGEQNSIEYGSKVYIYRVTKGLKLQQIAIDTAKVSQDGYVTLHLAQGGEYVLLPKAASKKVVSSLIDTVSLSLGKTTIKKKKSVSFKLGIPAGTMRKVSSFSEDNLAKLQSAQVAVKITYKSANKKIAKVSSNGKITGVKKGKTTVTATIRLSDGSKKVVKKKIAVK